ncbi:larval cuticle protein LCP-17-like [Epargyreus clarus]|uniref:larval cuticle protein LCP-17-like n=1 Tax=Epargyreus clarus TaxID=520877 RepID=UPI003C2DFF66
MGQCDGRGYWKLLILSVLVACVCADVSHIVNGEKSAKILKHEMDAGPDGTYQYSYETENGISAREQGVLKVVDKDNAAEAVQGEARWSSPEGEVVQLSYIADENGYQPQGSHIPTPPPIPDAILRALEYIRAHPPPPERP